MNSEKISYPVRFTPHILSEQYPDLEFCVPIYQRLFAWGEKQVMKLMNDLYEGFKTESTYYLGILTLVTCDDKVDLIDGQQRMSVLTLMAIAFRELSPDVNRYWNEFLRDGHRLSFSARYEDSSYIKARATGALVSYVNDRMEEGIGFIKAWCKAIFKNDTSDFDIEGFYLFSRYVWENLTLFCSYLPEKYLSNTVELNRYFESMNSSGRQLQQHEILLVELINGHPASESLSRLWSRIGDVGRRYIDAKEDWDCYRSNYQWMIRNYHTQLDVKDQTMEFTTIEEIMPLKVNRGSSSSIASRKMIISFEELLLMALKLTLGGEHTNSFYRPELLLTRFSEAKLKESGKIEEFFENLLLCRLILDYKIIWQETAGDFDYELLTVDNGKRIEKFQSMLYVSNSNQFYRWLPNYIKWLMDNPDSSVEEEMAELRKIDRCLHPSLPAMGDMGYHDIDRYWFWRLDYELWQRREEEDGWLQGHHDLMEAVKRYVFRANRSIEHLHPQTRTDDKSEEWEGRDLHRFGNLAMISSSFNSLQGKDSAGVKMERIHHQVETSQLQSLKMLHMWISYKESTEDSPGDAWTKDKVKLHEDIMASYLKTLF